MAKDVKGNEIEVGDLVEAVDPVHVMNALQGTLLVNGIFGEGLTVHGDHGAHRLGSIFRLAYCDACGARASASRLGSTVAPLGWGIDGCKLCETCWSVDVSVNAQKVKTRRLLAVEAKSTPETRETFGQRLARLPVSEDVQDVIDEAFDKRGPGPKFLVGDHVQVTEDGHTFRGTVVDNRDVINSRYTLHTDHGQVEVPEHRLSPLQFVRTGRIGQCESCKGVGGCWTACAELTERPKFQVGDRVFVRCGDDTENFAGTLVRPQPAGWWEVEGDDKLRSYACEKNLELLASAAQKAEPTPRLADLWVRDVVYGIKPASHPLLDARLAEQVAAGGYDIPETRNALAERLVREARAVGRMECALGLVGVGMPVGMTERDRKAPFWRFVDGNVSWHVTRRP